LEHWRIVSAFTTINLKSMGMSLRFLESEPGISDFRIFRLAQPHAVDLIFVSLQVLLIAFRSRFHELKSLLLEHEWEETIVSRKTASDYRRE